MDGFDESMAAGLDEALMIFGSQGQAKTYTFTGKGLTAGAVIKGTLGEVDEKSNVRVGGDDAKVTATLVLTRTGAPVGFEPKRGMTVTASGGRQYLVHDIGEDEVSWTLLLKDNR